MIKRFSLFALMAAISASAEARQIEAKRGLITPTIIDKDYGNAYVGQFRNQRQYRKHCRQNPSLYGSKKHRSKN